MNAAAAAAGAAEEEDVVEVDLDTPGTVPGFTLQLRPSIHPTKMSKAGRKALLAAKRHLRKKYKGSIWAVSVPMPDGEYKWILSKDVRPGHWLYPVRELRNTGRMRYCRLVKDPTSGEYQVTTQAIFVPGFVIGVDTGELCCEEKDEEQEDDEEGDEEADDDEEEGMEPALAKVPSQSEFPQEQLLDLLTPSTAALFKDLQFYMDNSSRGNEVRFIGDATQQELPPENNSQSLFMIDFGADRGRKKQPLGLTNLIQNKFDGEIDVGAAITVNWAGSDPPSIPTEFVVGPAAPGAPAAAGN